MAALGKSSAFERISSFPIRRFPFPREPSSLGGWVQRKMITLRKNILKALAEQASLDLKTPWSELPSEVRQFVLHGDDRKNYELKLQVGRGRAKKQPFPGVLKDLSETMRNTSSEGLRAKLLTYQVGTICSSCEGSRLSSYARSVTLARNL